MKNKKTAENKSQRPLGMPAGGICNGRWELICCEMAQTLN